MTSIGFRVHPKEVFYAIVERSSSGNSFSLASLVVPIALQRPEQLRYLRTNLLDITREYRAVRAGIRLAEHNTRSKLRKRRNIEGVVQEMLASSTVEYYVCGASNRLAPLLGLDDQRTFMRMASGDEVFEPIPNWEDLKKEQREALLAGIAAFELERSLV